jgi:hypothetical protein
MATNEYDFNDASDQRSIELIPTNTVCTLQINVRQGGVGDDGWLKSAADGNSEGLDCELVVVDGPFAKKKLFNRFTLHGKSAGHEQAGQISRATLRAILESARGIRPDDNSEAAKKAREVASWGDFDGLRFIGLIGIQPASNGYNAKNKLIEAVTPDRQQWSKVEQVQKPATPSTKPEKPRPANAIARPQWAEADKE